MNCMFIFLAGGIVGMITTGFFKSFIDPANLSIAPASVYVPANGGVSDMPTTGIASETPTTGDSSLFDALTPIKQLLTEMKASTADHVRCDPNTSEVPCPIQSCSTQQAAEKLVDKVATAQLLGEKFSLWSTQATPEMIEKSTCISSVIASIDSAKFPLVVKPNKGQKAMGVQLNIKDPIEVCEAIGFLVDGDYKKPSYAGKDFGKDIIIEQMAQGDTYRVVVYAGEVYDVYYRQAATVEGDGELSLKELHEARNRDRVGRKPKNNNYAVWPSKIEYGWIEDKYGYKPHDIIPEAQIVQIVTNTDRYNGCDQYHVPKALIHPDLIDHWVQVSHALDLGLAAFDYVAGEGGLATMEGGAVVDVNKQPAVEGPFEALAWEGYDDPDDYFIIKPDAPFNNPYKAIPCWHTTGHFCLCGSPRSKLWPGWTDTVSTATKDTNKILECLKGSLLTADERSADNC
ncbi:hypothetical protein TeGR_g6533 [Tetraparma gracilis]|uniref:ATP-grasp domain-containing protein n=1 Tax=Tetraparma gracilis TaxID=2962635 RepID=A0ABQ6MG83_9STRA|nr:hypothetical protein TeGR_g6533 [Tetraparma gracilis]